MLTFQEERFADARPEIEPLLTAHWGEVAIEKDTVPLNLDWATYSLLADAGALVVVTARENGVLVGYTSYIIHRHMHYDLRVADCGPFFLHPAHRKGRAGIRLFQAAENVLRQRGVQRVVHKVKLSHDVGPMFERALGYRPIERVYVKTLEE